MKSSIKDNIKHKLFLIISLKIGFFNSTSTTHIYKRMNGRSG